MNEMETQGRGRRWKEIATEFEGRSVDAVRAKGLSLLDVIKANVNNMKSSTDAMSEIPSVKSEIIEFEEITNPFYC